ncbi:mucin-1 [Rhea pennata]|uniref:mucin-1 n=1 Tax=Rhea pennata TaxID=8795 RepID=UPI002E25ACED
MHLTTLLLLLALGPGLAGAGLHGLSLAQCSCVPAPGVPALHGPVSLVARPRGAPRPDGLEWVSSPKDVLRSSYPDTWAMGTTMSETETTTMDMDTTTETMTTTMTTTTNTTTTTTTDTTTATTDTATTSVTTTPDTTTSNTTGVNVTQTTVPFRTTTILFTTRSYLSLTPSPDSPTSNTTTMQSTNSSASNTTANSTVVPVSVSIMIPHSNTTRNGSDVVSSPSTNTMGMGNTVRPTSSTTMASSSKVPPSSSTNGSSVVPTSGSNATADNGADVSPTGKVSVTTQGSPAPGKATTAVLVGSGTPNPSKAAVLTPVVVQLLLSIPLSFHILNKNFSESLLDPTSKEYVSLSQSVLAVFESVFGCVQCNNQQAYKGCSELRFSQGSVMVQSNLVFERGNGSTTSNTVEKQLKNSLDSNGFIMDLQLDNIQSAPDTTSPVPAPAVPGWAIALLVLVSILVLLSILMFFLLTACSCRRKSRGKLDLFSAKDSYHPMAEYPTYQSHGRYASPTSKHNPYSQAAMAEGPAPSPTPIRLPALTTSEDWAGAAPALGMSPSTVQPSAAGSRSRMVLEQLDPSA